MGGVYLIILNSRKAKKKKKINLSYTKIINAYSRKKEKKKKIKFLLSLKHIEIIYYIRKASD